MATDQVFGGGPVLAAKANDISIGTTAPTSPVTGQMWIDTSSTPVIKIWSGAAWIATGGFAVPAVVVGNTNVDGVALTAIRSDATLGILDANTPTGLSDYNLSGAAGTNAKASHSDHVHPTALDGSNNGVGSITNGATSFTISSLSSTYKRWRLRVYGLCTAAGVVAVQVNADTAANYFWDRHGVIANAGAHGFFSAQTNFTVGQLVGGSTSFYLDIEIWKPVAAQYALVHWTFNNTDALATDDFTVSGGGIWVNTASLITGITVGLGGGTFVTNSFYNLIGYR